MSKMTEEQARERLKAAGIDPNQWGAMGGGDPQSPQFAIRLATSLTKIKSLLEMAVGDKQGEIQQLEEKLLRLKHGGGS